MQGKAKDLGYICSLSCQFYGLATAIHETSGLEEIA